MKNYNFNYNNSEKIYVLPNDYRKNSFTKIQQISFDRVERPKSTVTYLILVASAVLQFTAFILIVITFIFPFWVSFKFTKVNMLANKTSILNVTNTVNSIFISSLAPTQLIQFEMGLWELKVNQNVYFFNLITEQIVNSSSSVLWLDAQYSNSYSSFVFNYLSFIELSSTSVFVVQILQVLHLIFTFLSLVSISLIVCLCTNKLISPCWYMFCFILAIIALSVGLAVIILCAVWQASSMPHLTSDSQIQLSKNFSWCWGVSLGVNSCLFIASLLIISFIIIDSLLLYEERKLVVNNKNKFEMNRDVVRCVPVDFSKIPRLQKSMLMNQKWTPLNVATSFRMLPSNGNSASYLLNFGNGYYYKRNLTRCLSGDDDMLDENFLHDDDVELIRDDNMQSTKF